MKEDIPWDLLARYFAGELNKKEKASVEKWINQSPEREKEMEQLRMFWHSDSNKKKQRPSDIDKTWNRLASAINTEERKQQHQGDILLFKTIYERAISTEKRRKAAKLLRRSVLVAATLLIAALTGIFTWQYNAYVLQSALDEPAGNVFITQNGEQAVYRLNDGSRVIMHAGSRLEIPANFNETERRLRLAGEAYFDVQHNPEKPFIVEADITYTKVLGTKFLVQNWPGDTEETAVIVEEGKVLFGDARNNNRDENHEVYLTRGQRGAIANGGEILFEEHTDLGWYIGWLNGRLEFNNRSLKEVLPKLERWYDIEISVSDEALLDKKITAEVDYSLPMTDVLNGLAMALEMNIARDGRNFILKQI